MTEDLWYNICTALGFPRKTLTALPIIISMYEEPNRYYHNWSHIERCIDEFQQYNFERCENGLSAAHPKVESAIIQYALVMHDAIYDPRSGRNEENSAFMAELLADCDVATEPILATKSHKRSNRELVNVVNDIDMSVLGTEPAEYKRYINGVHQEHCFISEMGWKHVRGIWIKTALAGPIFHTDYFREKYEDRARKNLKAELLSFGEEYVPPKEPAYFY